MATLNHAKIAHGGAVTRPGLRDSVVAVRLRIHGDHARVDD